MPWPAHEPHRRYPPGQVGQVFEVLSSDEGSKTDIPAWVAKARHELVNVVQDHGYVHFVVRKAR